MTLSRHRIAALTVAAALLAAGAAYTLLPASGGVAHAEGQPAAAAVDVAPALARTIVDWQRYSGRLEAIDRVDIRPLVSGTLTEVHFKDGALVKKGDVLFTIDPRPYAAEVDRAAAQLAAAQARAAYTASDLARAQRLLSDNAIAKRDFEEKQNAAREAAAHLLAARAAQESARIHLGYTRITAPVDGRVSRAEVTVGNVVNAGAQTLPLTTLVSVSPIYAAFDVDEQTFLKSVNPARAAGTEVPVQLGLANEDGYSREGVVHYVDNRLDSNSATIRLRAVFDNHDGSLLPGLYARVRLGGGGPREAVLVDEKAIGTDQNKRYVLVLDDQHRANYREVTLGANLGPLQVIEKGLKPGEQIVVNGLQRVRPGSVVAPTVVSMDTAPQAVKTAAAALK
ncbi:efflux RND transporter periplasmic adaptor subunit [Bordetella avium]|uniref:efflux RND transporter periplasmic adaptor subunit n=1 Tax=Bordetella avium TaxID=521 RepID=UPI000E6A747F|nr:efflux RND transporter periplasmic adaptor subunit [Bordetella avium]AZY47987.1 efflux transporter periplasmic adaptor subunit [Bordetella avium]RIQ18730.1 efflux RND transporter periplasmic adaptor subunit [Bordetella avium]RIQ35235.1 efflux RND transporter periplasmic adaptor subunit [Bordetella avium]RIQ72075.1 efflux RND transporter periplasmic adaptor subunit [Bordetella avium]